MANIIYIHPDNPQARLIRQVADKLNQGGVIVLPTDSGYALTCLLDNKTGQDRIASIRKLEKKHFFSLLCGSLSHIAEYALVDNRQYKLLKSATPGGFTFILQAGLSLPKRLFANVRKTIGIRVPDHNIVQALLTELNQPLLSTTLILPDEDIAELFSDEINDKIGHQVDLIIDGGVCSFEPTTVLDLSEGMPPQLVRAGQGDASVYL